MLVIVALTILIVLLYVTERVRATTIARHRRRTAEARLQAAMLETEKRVEREKAKAAQAAQLTSVMAAIQKPDKRHVA